MGGHGAVAYARTHPEKIAGVMLFAPYMGPGEVVDEVKREAGCVAGSRAPATRTRKKGFARANFSVAQASRCEARAAHDLAGRGRSRWLVRPPTACWPTELAARARY